MSYSFQTFSVGQVLTAAQVNQLEANIRDHQHGVDGVSGAGTFNNTGLHILELSGTDDMIISPSGTLTADRTLSIAMGDADRLVTLNGAFTVESASTIDQDLSTDSEVVQFGKVKVQGSGDPKYLWIQAGAAADNGRWDMLVNSAQMLLRAVNDIDTTAGNIMTVTRSGTVIGQISFPATSVLKNGSEIMTLASDDTITGIKTFSTAPKANAIVPTVAASGVIVSSCAIVGRSAARTLTVVDYSGLGVLYYYSYVIGDWNMSSISAIAISNILSKDNIRSVTALIRNDSNTTRYDLASANVGSTGAGPSISITNSFINLRREDGGIFTDGAFVSTSYNRGWVFVVYEEMF